MANPQLENGHTQIANETLDHLVKIHLSPNQWQVLLFIIRKTYGYHKKVDYIANFQIVESTELCKAVVSRALERLTELNIINRKGKYIGFQKDWEQWQKLAESSTKVSSLANNQKLAESSTLDSKLAIQSTNDLTIKVSNLTQKLAISSTKVSSPAVAQKIKETIQKKKRVISYSPEELKSSDWYKNELLKEYPSFTDKEYRHALTWLEEHPDRKLNKSFLINWAKNNPNSNQISKPEAHKPGHRVPERYKTPEELLAEN